MIKAIDIRPGMCLTNEHIVGPALLRISALYSRNVTVQNCDFNASTHPSTYLWPLVFLTDIELIGCTTENVWLDLSDMNIYLMGYYG